MDDQTRSMLRAAYTTAVKTRRDRKFKEDIITRYAEAGKQSFDEARQELMIAHASRFLTN